MALCVMTRRMKEMKTADKVLLLGAAGLAGTGLLLWRHHMKVHRQRQRLQGAVIGAVPVPLARDLGAGAEAQAEVRNLAIQDNEGEQGQARVELAGRIVLAAGQGILGEQGQAALEPAEPNALAARQNIQGEQGQAAVEPAEQNVEAAEENIQEEQGQAAVEPAEQNVEAAEENIQGEQGQAAVEPAEQNVEAAEENIQGEQGQAAVEPAEQNVEAAEENIQGEQGQAAVEPAEQNVEAAVQAHEGNVEEQPEVQEIARLRVPVPQATHQDLHPFVRGLAAVQRPDAGHNPERQLAIVPPHIDQQRHPLEVHAHDAIHSGFGRLWPQGFVPNLHRPERARSYTLAAGAGRAWPIMTTMLQQHHRQQHQQQRWQGGWDLSLQDKSVYLVTGIRLAPRAMEAYPPSQLKHWGYDVVFSCSRKSGIRQKSGVTYITFDQTGDYDEDLESLIYLFLRLDEVVRAFGTAMLVILDCGCTTALVTALLMARQRHTLGDSLMMLHRLPNFTELSAGFRMQLLLWREQARDRSVHAFQMEVKFGYAIPVLWRGKLTPEMLDSKKVLIFHDGDKQFVWQGSATGKFWLQAAIFATENFWRYERRDTYEVVREGAEPRELMDLIKPHESQPAKKPKKPTIWQRAFSCFAATQTVE